MLGLLGVAVAGWLWLRPSDEHWVVEARDPQVPLTFHDPCISMPGINDAFAAGGGAYFAQLGADSRVDADRIAGCYEGTGLTTAVRRATDDDQTRLDGGMPECDGSDRLPCTYDPQ